MSSNKIENQVNTNEIPNTNTNTNTMSSSIPSVSAPPSPPAKMNFFEFLKSHQINKTSQLVSTNTRIGDKELQLYGGSYHIPEDEYPLFLNLYYNEVFIKNKKEYFTEKQLEKDGAILIDIDLRFNYELNARVYSDEHIEDLISLYLEKLKNIYEFDDETEFYIYVFEKTNIKRDEKKNIVKDGIHIIIGLPSDHDMQQYLRQEIISKIDEIWGDFPITNSWDEVFDEGISKGHINWQLYGSSKPGCEAYSLTKMFQIKFETETNIEIIHKIPILDIDIKEVFPKLSVRNRNLPICFYKNTFIQQLQNKIDSGEIISVNEDNKRCKKHNESMSTTSTFTENILSPLMVLQIKSMDELKSLVDHFIDKLNNEIEQKYIELKEAYDYTMILPSSYYTEYSKWIRVGWALRNIHDSLFIVWVVFSSQCVEKFQIIDIPDLFSQWQTFDLNNLNGLTKRSIMHWANVDAHDNYKKVRENSVDYFIEQTIYVSKRSISEDKKVDKGCGDYDIATVLHQLFKDVFVCASVKAGIWYQYTKHRWEEIDSGTTLRKKISTELRDIYRKKMLLMMQQITLEKTKTDKDEDKIKVLDYKFGKVGEILIRLARTNDKKNIMTEAKELFFDPNFMEKLDTNPYLLCFNNGVIDFKEKKFRKGYPDDYISKTTNNNYIDLSDPIVYNKYLTIIDEINDFMRKLFPKLELYNYMWEHLASTLIGTSSNQTFNMYIGIGQNGKSVLVSLMESVLGQYKGDVPLSLVTEKRVKVGGLAPEIVALKGIRYAVMQEPSKGDRINEGMMKQLTSGIDPIQARAPYMPQSITFIPQFKLTLCCNELMVIKSQDHGTWRRIRVVDFLSLFVDKPVTNDPDKPYQFLLDKNIKEKFLYWKEIFAGMLVLKAFETNGNVNDCNMVLQSSNEYRNSQDYVAEFIADKIIVDINGKITKSEITQEFNSWYLGTYGKGGPSPKEVQSYMDKKYGPFKLQKCWKGVRINYDTDITTDTPNEDSEFDLDQQFDIIENL
jgi:P4 family phage/plasmid primase-like protien